MSLYDELECFYPLPDGWNSQGHIFKTKDTPMPYLLRYVLTTDGRLILEATGEPMLFHGALTFYTGNIGAHGPFGVMTTDGQPPWWAEYTALFDHGQLLKLEGAWRLAMVGPHLTREEWHARHQAWEQERAVRRDYTEPQILTQGESDAV